MRWYKRALGTAMVVGAGLVGLVGGCYVPAYEFPTAARQKYLQAAHEAAKERVDALRKKEAEGSKESEKIGFYDVNSDGHKDMIITDNDGNVRVLENDGKGNYINRQQISDK